MNLGTSCMFFSSWLLLSVCVVTVHGAIREILLRRTTRHDCQTLKIGDPWTSDSVTTCLMKCMDRYPDNCQSILYNHQTNLCTPGSAAFRPLAFITTSLPWANSTDTIYFVEQPYPSCEHSSFVMYSMCGLTLCVYMSSGKADYSQARTGCDQMGSRLFVANTMAKFSMFWHLSLANFNWHTWLGLTDTAVEGEFVWANGDPLSEEQDQYIWHPGQPDSDKGTGEEDCIEARHTTQYDKGVSDNACHNTKYYFCEPNDS